MSESQRKYPKVTGWWVYIIKTPNDMYYPGYSGGKDGNKQCRKRWNQNSYKETALSPYIEEYGWDNLEKIVVVDGLTEDEAVKWEGVLIKLYRSMGCCINKQRSGNITKNNDYKHLLYLEHRDEILERVTKYREEHQDDIKIKNHIYYEEHKEEIKNKRRKYYEEHKEEIKIKQDNPELKNEKKKYMGEYHRREEYKIKQRDRRHQPEFKIYDRVLVFNCRHPDRITETPLEAKNKYLEYGYIPTYIKSDDLF